MAATFHGKDFLLPVDAIAILDDGFGLYVNLEVTAKFYVTIAMWLKALH